MSAVALHLANQVHECCKCLLHVAASWCKNAGIREHQHTNMLRVCVLTRGCKLHPVCRRGLLPCQPPHPRHPDCGLARPATSSPCPPCDATAASRACPSDYPSLWRGRLITGCCRSVPPPPPSLALSSSSSTLCTPNPNSLPSPSPFKARRSGRPTRNQCTVDMSGGPMAVNRSPAQVTMRAIPPPLIFLGLPLPPYTASDSLYFEARAR